MLNKKAIMTAIAGIICAGVLGVVILSIDKPPKEPTAAVFNEMGENGARLVNVLNTSVDLTKRIDNAYVPLEVKMAFIDGGGCARVIVHNNTDTPITAYDIEIIHFDKNGLPIGENSTFTVNNIILNGRTDGGIDKYVGGKSDGEYIKAVIKRVLYNDGTAWENTKADIELTLNAAAFDVEEFNSSIQKNADNVQKAAQNPYIFMNDMTIAGADEISKRKDLKLVLTNTSDKEIKDIKVAVAQFDKDNKPIDASPQTYVGKNIRLAICRGMKLGSNESRSFASALFLESDCYRINAVVTEITFEDGTIWKNPYELDWLLWFM